MGAFKKIDRQDVYLESYTANKPWTIASASYTVNGIESFLAEKPLQEAYLLDDTDLSDGQYTKLVYRSLDQLYYRGFESGSLETTSYDHFINTSLESSTVRELLETAYVISIPTNLYGAAIKQGTVELTLQSAYQTIYTTIEDNKEGKLILIGSPEIEVGDIIYQHGIIIITDEDLVTHLVSTGNPDITFKSTHSINSYSIHCKLKDYEFNYTLNPTAKTPTGALKTNIDNEAFNPYITSIGLYNDACELIGVAKVPYPLPKSSETEMTILIKIDV